MISLGVYVFMLVTMVYAALIQSYVVDNINKGDYLAAEFMAQKNMGLLALILWNTGRYLGVI